MNKWFEVIENGTVYAYSVMIDGNRDEWAYIGRTKRPLAVRHNEHMNKQPWSDLLPEVRVLKSYSNVRFWKLALTEWYYIKTKKPLFNDIYNYSNPRRIPNRVASQERFKRDKRLVSRN